MGKYTTKKEFRRHMELVHSVETKMKEEDEHLKSRLDDKRKEKPLKKALARVSNEAESREAAVAAAEVAAGKTDEPVDAKNEQFDRLKAELLKKVEELAAQQAKDKEVHEKSIANQPASARATAEEAFDHKQQDTMTQLRRTNDERLDLLRNKLWPPKLYRRLMIRENKKDTELENITKKRLKLLEKSLGTSLSDDLTDAVNSLPKTLESYEDETRMCRYIGVGCTGEPTSSPTYIDPITNLPGKGSNEAADEGEEGDGQDKGDWGLEPGDNPVIQNTTDISNNSTDNEDGDNQNRMTEEERKKEIIEAYEEELQNEDKGQVLADKQEEREDRRAAKGEWLQMHHGFRQAEEDKQDADQEELENIIQEKHAEEQQLHDTHVTRLNDRKQELIQTHTALLEKNEKDMKEYRQQNQKKLNDKRGELYPGYTPPDDQPKVEESIIYVHNDDDDGDDDVSEGDDDYDVHHNIDDADGGDLKVAESGSLTNETDVPRSSMEDLNPKDGDNAGEADDEEGGEDKDADEDDSEEGEDKKVEEDDEEEDDEGDDALKIGQEDEDTDKDAEGGSDKAEKEDEADEDGESLAGDKDEEGIGTEDGESHDGDGHVEEVGKNHDGDDYIAPGGESTSSGDDDGYYDDDTKARAAKLAHRLSAEEVNKKSSRDK